MPTKSKTNNKATTLIRTSEEIRDSISKCRTEDDPEIVLKEADKEFRNSKSSKLATTSISNAFKAMTLLEFENGMLMSTVVPEQYKTFGIDMLRRLQKDYNCTLISEMAVAELATISYIRTLELQHIMDSSLARSEKHQMNMLYITIVGKELDRANRQFLAAIQTLRMMKQPSLQLNIKANTAVIGQNQLVQADTNE